MKCWQCNDLIQVFRSRLAGYVKARATPFYRVSTELAARKQVDMERARGDLEEHLWAWHFARDEMDLEGVQRSPEGKEREKHSRRSMNLPEGNR